VFWVRVVVRSGVQEAPKAIDLLLEWLLESFAVIEMEELR
jgi:hypothetical protein